MSFKIIAPTPPTNDRMVEIATDWWKIHKGINFLEWNETLLQHTYPLNACKIPSDLVQKTLDIVDGKGTLEELSNLYAPIIQPALTELNCEENFFIKLITRSPKDFLCDFDSGFELDSIPAAVNAISGSMRCFEDLCMLKYIDMAYLIVRPFIPFEEWQEWRVFVKDGKITGISQYYYMTNYYFSDEKVKEIETEIRNFMASVVIPNMSLPTFVADIIVKGDYDDRDTVILETNPYGLSDPCIFGDYESLDGSFQYTKS
jgi:hypothetical protein